MKRCPQLPTSRNKRADVYVIPCKDCDDRYIGQTGKKLSIRWGQHKDAFRLGYKTNSVCKTRLWWKSCNRLGKRENGVQFQW